jgi:hypothetical protein
MPPTQQRLSITPDDLEALIQREVSRAFIRIGIAQADDGEAVELQKDFSYLRDLRLGSQAIKNKGVLGILAFLGAGLLALVYFGLRYWIQNPGALPPGHP